MKILKILKNKNYLLLAISSSLFMLIIYPLLQAYATGGLQNLDLWLKVIPKLNFMLVILFSILFGLLLTLQIFNLKTKICSIKNKTVSASIGTFGTVLAFLAPACPACLSIVSLLIPAALSLSLIQFLVKFNTTVLIISNILMILGLLLLGGFKSEN